MEEKELTENQKKKEFLQSYQVARRDVDRLEEQLKELRRSKQCPVFVIGDGMPHAHDATDLSGYAAEVDALEQKIIKARLKRIQTYAQVQRSIEQMENERAKTLLTYRYLLGMKWEEICVKMDYKWRQVHRIHSEALKNLKRA